MHSVCNEEIWNERVCVQGERRERDGEQARWMRKRERRKRKKYKDLKRK